MSKQLLVIPQQYCRKWISLHCILLLREVSHGKRVIYRINWGNSWSESNTRFVSLLLREVSHGKRVIYRIYWGNSWSESNTRVVSLFSSIKLGPLSNCLLLFTRCRVIQMFRNRPSVLIHKGVNIYNYLWNLQICHLTTYCIN